MHRQTCYGCDYLLISRSTKILKIYGAYCERTEFIVPQECDAEKRTITFWRVPMECPLSQGVIKSQRPVAKKYWVTKTFGELEIND